MDVATQVLKSTRELKEKIRAAASDAVAEFERETGMTPSGIRVSMIEGTIHNSTMRKFLVGQVQIDFNSL